METFCVAGAAIPSTPEDSHPRRGSGTDSGPAGLCFLDHSAGARGTAQEGCVAVREVIKANAVTATHTEEGH